MNIKHLKKLLLTGVLLSVGVFHPAQAAPPAGYTWNTIISDDFNSFNTSIWGSGSTPWGTQNQSSCTIIPAEDTYVSGGSLVLRSRLGPFTGTGGTSFAYSSGWAWTKQYLTYGYLEIRAQYPNHQGAWPAFWMLGSGWPPEIDIAEFRGAPLDYMTMALYDLNSTWNTTTRSGDYTGWHTYGLDWQPGYLAYYIDGVIVKTITGSSVPSIPMYAILSNGTECSQSNGTGFPNYYNIDYFRWYQRASTTLPNGTYSLRNRATGKMLDNLGSTANGATVGQWGDNSSNNQNWTVSTIGSYRKLMCLTGSKYLDSLGHTGNGSTVGQWSSRTSNNQQWTIQDAGGGYYYVINRANGLYLDSAGATTDGAAMVFWSSSGSYNQQWQFVAP